MKTFAGPAGRKTGRQRQSGVTLVEVLISMVVLTIGLVGMLGVLGMTIKATQASQENSVAKTIADEALESILTARETATTSTAWSQIANTNNGGIFLTGFQPVCNAGADGIYGTADDCASGEQTLELPASDGIFHGTVPPDSALPLSNYQRQIVLTPDASCGGAAGCNLMDVTITVQFQTAAVQFPQTYTLSTFISEYR